MKNWKKLVFLLTLFVLPLCGTNLSAQSGKAILSGVSKGMSGIGHLSKTSPQTMNALLQATHRSMVASAAVKPVSAAVKPAVTPTATPAAAIPAPAALPENTTVARFVNSHKKLLYSLQTTVGIPSKTAVENLRSWGAKPLQKPRRPALLTENAFTAPDFKALRYKDGLVPPLPFVRHPHYMYRGLGLAADGASLRNILENGLLIKDVGRNSNDRRLAYASAGGMAALKAVARERVTNLTDSPDSALHYAWRHAGNGLVVMVSVKESVERGAIVTVAHDIPAEQIHEVIALLEVNGKPAWCKIEPAEDGFKITPYNSVGN